MDIQSHMQRGGETVPSVLDHDIMNNQECEYAQESDKGRKRVKDRAREKKQKEEEKE